MLTSLKVSSLSEKKRKTREDDPRRWLGHPRQGKERYKPLPAMLEAFEAMIAARGDKNWKDVGYYAFRTCDHWANLPDAERAALAPAFPNSPDFLGEGSGGAWIAYLISLIVVPKRRECARGALRAAVARGGGGRVTPPEWASVCGNIFAEAPF
jgi:hypothetical protein